MEEPEIEKSKSFAVNLFAIPQEGEAKLLYDHGYPLDQVEEIKQKKLAIEKRVNNNGEPASLEELKTVIVPWQRIIRTEAFNLNPEKPKKEKVIKVPKAPKEPRQKKEKTVAIAKVKKLTQKQIQEKLSGIIMRKAMKREVTEEEEQFFKEQAEGKII